jgi:oligoendopeptidase, M3 family
MKFSECEYKRPNMKEFESRFNELLKKFDSADSFELQDSVMEAINKLRGEFESMGSIASIRHTINTLDQKYEEEQNFFDENLPVYEGLVVKYYNLLINSKHRKELEEKWGKQLFNIAELTIKTFSPKIVEDLKEENELTTAYTKLVASAKILFEGEERTLPQLTPFIMSTDRKTRKKADEAKYNFFKENESKFNEIYDRLVKVRTRIARKLGYGNFVELGYARMIRTDYDAKMVEKFRCQVKDRVVPTATKLRARQRKRLGLKKLCYYDELLYSKDGNATPRSKDLIKSAKQMYSELSKETGEFFEFMINNELMDLVSKKGKTPGGYTSYIQKYKSPFIFSNFNGTLSDVDVLTHEAGHAFQAYSSKDHEIPEYLAPTAEACEIHSMSMEFLTWPWMNLFFDGDADKYRFDHLSKALLFIPYGVTVDEFQYWVYENPEATPAQRKKVWRELEKKYLPHRDYEDNKFLENGGYWYQQLHIFLYPFYYIDYTLAQICAFQFWKRSMENSEEAWNDYIKLCKAGGSKSFLNLVELANLRSPFENGCLESVIGVIEDWLDNVDDTEL